MIERWTRRHSQTPALPPPPPSEAEQVCGAVHPNVRTRKCTLPAGHGEVEVPTFPIPMTHADLSDPNAVVGWKETR